MRYFLSAFAFVPLFAGAAVSTFANQKKYLLVIALVIIASFNSIYWNYLLLKKPTFDQVRDWIDLNLPPEIPIAATVRRNFDYVPTAEASAPIRKFKPEFYRRAAKIVGNSYPDNVRNVLYLSEFGKNSKIENLREGMAVYPVSYVVDSYYSKSDRLLAQRSDITMELVAHFSPTGSKIYNERMPQILFDSSYNFPLFRVDSAGPYFDVLKIE